MTGSRLATGTYYRLLGYLLKGIGVGQYATADLTRIGGLRGKSQKYVPYLLSRALKEGYVKRSDRGMLVVVPGSLERLQEELKKKAPPPPKPPKIGPNANTLAREVDRQRQVVQTLAKLGYKPTGAFCPAFRLATALKADYVETWSGLDDIHTIPKVVRAMNGGNDIGIIETNGTGGKLSFRPTQKGADLFMEKPRTWREIAIVLWNLNNIHRRGLRYYQENDETAKRAGIADEKALVEFTEMQLHPRRIVNAAPGRPMKGGRAVMFLYDPTAWRLDTDGWPEKKSTLSIDPPPPAPPADDKASSGEEAVVVVPPVVVPNADTEWVDHAARFLLGGGTLAPYPKSGWNKILLRAAELAAVKEEPVK